MLVNTPIIVCVFPCRIKLGINLGPSRLLVNESVNIVIDKITQVIEMLTVIIIVTIFWIFSLLISSKLSLDKDWWLSSEKST